MTDALTWEQHICFIPSWKEKSPHTSGPEPGNRAEPERARTSHVGAGGVGEAADGALVPEKPGPCLCKVPFLTGHSLVSPPRALRGAGRSEGLGRVLAGPARLQELRTRFWARRPVTPFTAAPAHPGAGTLGAVVVFNKKRSPPSHHSRCVSLGAWWCLSQRHV